MYYSVKCMHLPFNHCNIKADATTSMFVFSLLTNHNLYRIRKTNDCHWFYDMFYDQ